MKLSLDPFDSLENKEKFMQIAEYAGTFVARYVYTLTQNGMPAEAMAGVVSTIGPAIISQLLINHEAVRKTQQLQILQEYDPGDTLPN